MEKVFKQLEALGYPRAGTDWLRRQRLLVIVVLACLSWAGFMLTVIGLYNLSIRLTEVIRDLVSAMV